SSRGPAPANPDARERTRKHAASRAGLCSRAPMSISQVPPSSIAAYLDDCIFAIRKRVAIEPRVGVVLGSGLGAFADRLEGLVKIPYRDLPHMPASAVVGHAGNLCFGTVGGVPVVCMQGRVHLYEGHTVAKVVQGVRTMA